jgi:hypothetical protein
VSELADSGPSSLPPLPSPLSSPPTMSDLQRSFLKAKLAHLPPVPPDDVVEAPPEVDFDDSSSSASSASSTGTIKPLQSKSLFAVPTGFVEVLTEFIEVEHIDIYRTLWRSAVVLLLSEIGFASFAC